MPDKKDALAKSSTAITKPQPITLDQLMQLAEVEVDQAKLQTTIDAMSFSELNDFIIGGVKCVIITQANLKKMRQALKPALIRVHKMCGGQGKRNDLTGGITWTAFCNRLSQLGAGCARTWASLVAEADLDNPAKSLLGKEVLLLPNGTDRPLSRIAEVTAVHEKTNPNDDAKVDVTYKTLDETGKEVKKELKAVRTTEVQTVKEKRLPALHSGDLVILLDIEGGAEFSLDNMTLTRTATPSPTQLMAAKTAKREADSKANAQAHKDRIVEAVAAVKDGMALNDAATQFKVGRKEISSQLPKVTPVPKVKAVAKKKEATAKPKTPRKAKEIAVELVARRLGDKFFLFAKNEVEFSPRTTKSSQFDYLDEAEAVAAKLNTTYGFVTPMDALVDKAKTEGSITMNEYYEALASTDRM
jgi:hypothetical protein